MGGGPAYWDGMGETALIMASVQGHTDTVKLLLERGAEIETRDEGRVTALMWAALGGHIDSVRALLEAGAAVQRASALWLAALGGHTDSVRALLEAGAQVGDAALIGAALGGHTDSVRALLEAGAQVNPTDWYRDKTALMGAAEAGDAPITSRIHLGACLQ